MTLRLVIEEYLEDVGGQVIERSNIDTLIDLETLAKTDDPDVWSGAALLVGKLVLNKVKEITNDNLS